MVREGLQGRYIAVIATDGIEELELVEPWASLLEAEAVPVLVSFHPGQIQATRRGGQGETFTVEQTADAESAEGFDALVLLGGTAGAERAGLSPDAAAFIRAFIVARKPVAALAQSAWMLEEVAGPGGRRSADVLHAPTPAAVGTPVRAVVGIPTLDVVGIPTLDAANRGSEAELRAFCAEMLDRFAERWSGAPLSDPARADSIRVP